MNKQQRLFSMWVMFVVCFSSCESERIDNPCNDQTYILVPVDSIGVFSGDEEYLFGSISGVCYLRNGDIAIADRAFNNVRVFSRDGEFLEEIKAAGSGPGEFNAPLQVSPWEDGFIVNSLIDRKILFFDSNHEFVYEVLFSEATIRPGCPVYVQAVNDSTFIGHTFFMIQTEGGELQGGTELALWNGNEKDIVFRRRLADHFNPMTYQIDGRICSCLDVERKRLYWADATDSYYTINCTGIFNGSSEILLDREWQPLVKPDSVIQQERELMIRSWREGTGQDPDFEFEITPCYKAIEALDIGPGGLLWVTRGTDGMPFFDVFDLDGSYAFRCIADLPEQLCDRWAFFISPQGILAYPSNPVLVERLYIMEIQLPR